MAQEYISRKGLEKLKELLKELIEVKRPEIINQISRAREMGDLSENAEYHAAREKQREIENEIAKLQQKVASLKVIDTENLKKDEVRFGAVVGLYDLNSKKNLLYQVVGDDETGKVGEIHKISCNSPIGRALLGQKVGNEVKVRVPAGVKHYKIKSITYPESKE
jgi:transcription elongation factor GreA